MNEIKLVMCDMDGTLLNDHKEVDSGFINLIDPLNDMGVMVGIASGRQYHSITRNFKDIYEKMVFIADNGAIIYVNDEIVDYRALDRDILEEIIKITETDENLSFILCGIKCAYLISDNETVLWNANHYCNGVEKMTSLDDVLSKDEIIKVTVFDMEYNVKEKINKYIHLRDRINVVKSGFEWIDFNVLGVNKGSAIQKLKKLYNLSRDNCMAFRDFNNDIEMLKEVKYSVAMANANEDVKAVCNYSCKSNNENGVSEKLKEVFNL